MQGTTTSGLPSSREDPARSRIGATRGVLFAAGLAALWGVLNAGQPASWLVGAPVIALAVWTAAVLPAGRPLRMRPAAALRFALFFFYTGLVGAIEVARRAFHPALPLAPGLMTYRLRLPEGAGRVLLADVTSLLPGTLSADLQGATLTIHALVAQPRVLADLRVLEEHIAALFGVELREGLRA